MSSKATWQKHLSIKFILCEDVRSEIYGKLSLIGVYPGETVVLVNSPPAGTPKGQMPAISSLAFVFLVSNGNGKASPRIVVTDPKGTSGTPLQLAESTFVPENSVPIAGVAKPFVVTELGEFSIALDIGGAEFQFPFRIRKAKGKEAQLLAFPVIAPNRPKKKPKKK
jgi:hypothetical protein